MSQDLTQMEYGNDPKNRAIVPMMSQGTGYGGIRGS